MEFRLTREVAVFTRHTWSDALVAVADVRTCTLAAEAGRVVVTDGVGVACLSASSSTRLRLAVTSI